MTAEEWRSVDEFDGAYEVSSYGNVRSVDRTITSSTGKQIKYKGRTIKKQEDRYGYLVVLFSRGTERRTLKVHRLVALKFLPKTSPSLCVVNHLDFNKKNNSIENLEWVTVQGNNRHSLMAGKYDPSINKNMSRENPNKRSEKNWKRDPKINVLMSGNNPNKNSKTNPRLDRRRNPNYLSQTKVTAEMAWSFVEFYRRGKTQKHIAKCFGVSTTSVSNVLRLPYLAHP